MFFPGRFLVAMGPIVLIASAGVRHHPIVAFEDGYFTIDAPDGSGDLVLHERNVRRVAEQATPSNQALDAREESPRGHRSPPPDRGLRRVGDDLGDCPGELGGDGVARLAREPRGEGGEEVAGDHGGIHGLDRTAGRPRLHPQETVRPERSSPPTAENPGWPQSHAQIQRGPPVGRATGSRLRTRSLPNRRFVRSANAGLAR